jgi:hypothetical protein
MDWDDSHIYLAVKSNKPFDLMAAIDCNNDGWYHGEDNYEFRAMRGAGSTVLLTISRYESQHTRVASAVPVTDAEAAMVTMKSSSSDNAYMTEMSMPLGLVRGLKLSAGRKIGLEFAIKTGVAESDWIPASSPGDTRECTLVDKKIASLKPIVLGFDMAYSKIARGDDIVARFHITNSGNERVDVRSFVIGGEGMANDYLSSAKVRMEGIAPKQHLSQEYRSVVLSNMPLGNWALGAEVMSGDKRIGGALASFEVVEPYELKIVSPTASVRTDVKDVSFTVQIVNYRRDEIHGTAKITLPPGWQLWKDKSSYDFVALGKERISAVLFKAKPPLGVIGDVPFKIDVSADGVSKSVEGTVKLVNP